MTTNCKTCGCADKKCGCQDTMLTTPAPCPTPVGCPNPEPCSEVIDAQCVIYTNPSILCNQDVVVETSTSVAEALNNIVDYFCGGAGGSVTVVEAGINVTVSSDTVGDTTTYTVNALCPMQVALTYTPVRGVEATVTGGTPPYIYNWEMADVRFGVGADSMFILTPGILPNYTLPLINPAFVDKIDMSSGTKQGSYGIVKSIVTDANGCIAKDIILLIDIAPIVV